MSGLHGSTEWMRSNLFISSVKPASRSPKAGPPEWGVQDQAPPKGYVVTVRVVRDYGEVAFSVGAAQLAAGSVHTLPLEEAQPLLRSGVLENLDDFS